jgi:hypothetical protein
MAHAGLIEGAALFLGPDIRLTGAFADAVPPGVTGRAVPHQANGQPC